MHAAKIQTRHSNLTITPPIRGEMLRCPLQGRMGFAASTALTPRQLGLSSIPLSSPPPWRPRQDCGASPPPGPDRHGDGMVSLAGEPPAAHAFLTGVLGGLLQLTWRAAVKVVGVAGALARGARHRACVGDGDLERTEVVPGVVRSQRSRALRYRPTRSCWCRFRPR